MDDKELLAMLSEIRSRGQVKHLGQRADREPELRRALLRRAGALGRAVPPDLSGKRLVRWVLDRGDGAQVRSNPIRRDEAFTCAHCGVEVAPGGARVRDHCPRCLRSLHVDVVPGDRANPCGGILDPVGFRLDGSEVTVLYRCRSCGADHRVRAHPTDAVPPSLDPKDLPA